MKNAISMLVLLAILSLTTTSSIASSYDLSATAATAQPGASLQVNWIAPSGSSGWDWVGLYKVGDPNRNFIINKLTYTGGRTSGTFTTTAPTTPGNYEFRYLLNDGYTDVKRSSPITVGSSSPTLTIATVTPTSTSHTLSASPSSAQAGASLTASWTAPSGSSGQDWVGLFKVGDANQTYIPNKLIYTGGKTSGSFTTTAPPTAGNYEFRYLLNNGYTDVKRSNPISVAGGTTSISSQTPVTGSHSLSTSASSVLTGASVSVSWTAPTGSSAYDWVSLYKVGDSNQSFIANKWVYTGGRTSGSFTTTAPTTAGNYEFRYLLNNSYTDVKRSNPVAVTSAVTSTPTTSQTPTTNPVAPSTSCDTGVSVAPCKAANLRFLVVAQDGSGQFNNIQAAINASLPGDTIQVKNGAYSTNLTIPATKSGTQSLPLALVNYPGHKPRVNGNLSIYAEWVLVEGFEITQADDTLTMYRAFDQSASTWKAGHITIRNNWIHDASFMGVFAGSVSDLLFEGNTFEKNGLGPKNCIMGDGWGGHTQAGYGYVHCHGIYLGSWPGDPATARVTVRRNSFISNTGSGFQHRPDSEPASNYLIENNLFINNQRAMNLSDMNNSIIRNNTIVQFDYPRPNTADKACFFINRIPNNIIANNACYLALNPAVENVLTMWNWDPTDPRTGTKWSHNAFFGWPKTSWIWGGGSMSDFLNDYRSATGDTGGLTVSITRTDGSDAGFVNGLGGDFHPRSSSPLIGSGNPTYCAAVDFDGKARPSGRCDIGAFAY